MPLKRPAMLVAFAAALTSCGDGTGTGARFTNRDGTPFVFAINGSPQSLPTALRIRTQAAVPVDGTFSFDVAFDLNATGDSVIVHSVRSIANELVSVHRVGMQLTTQTFDEVTEAPTTGFVYDTTFRVAAGQTMLLDVIEAGCQFESILGFNIRAKMVVESIDAPNRKIFLHVLTNPNCGFRSLQPGEPKS
jgi:hypothetical protein